MKVFAIYLENCWQKDQLISLHKSKKLAEDEIKKIVNEASEAEKARDKLYKVSYFIKAHEVKE